MQALAAFIFRLRFALVSLWGVGTLLLALYLYMVPYQVKRTPLYGALGTEALAVEQLMESEFGISPALSGALVVQGPVPPAVFFDDFRKTFPQLVKIQKVPGRTAHQNALYLLLYHPETPMPEAVNSVPHIQKFLTQSSRKYKTHMLLTGHVGFIYDTNNAAKEESSSNEKLALSLAFLILVLNFGSLLSSLLPILMGGTTLILLSVLGRWLNLPMTPASLIMNSMVGLALAIDYSLFMVSRFNEEKKAQPNAFEALKVTLFQAGETILFSALVMLVSISVLLIPNVSATRAVVVGLSVVIAISLAVSLVVLPALLLVVQPALDWPKVLSRRLQAFNSYGFWRQFSEHVVRYPKTYFWGSLLAIVLLSAPALNMRLWAPIHSLAPPGSQAYEGYHLLKEDGWGGEIMPIQVVVQAPQGQSLFSKPALKTIEQFSQFAQQQPQVADVVSLTRWNPQFELGEYYNLYQSTEALKAFGMVQSAPYEALVSPQRNTGIIQVIPQKEMNVQDIYDTVHTLRTFQPQSAALEFHVGGVVARSEDFILEIYQYLPHMVGLIILGIFSILLYYMKAFVLPLKAALMNFLPIFGAYGFVTLVFQYGYGSSVLNTPHNGGITGMVPVILFCVVFGLSMDYEVLIISRISEVYREKNDVREAVIEGLARSGSVITGAALILLGVFMPGILSDSPLVKEIALGISMAILLDATLLRLFLVPTFILLMGKWNWWWPFNRRPKP